MGLHDNAQDSTQHFVKRIAEALENATNGGHLVIDLPADAATQATLEAVRVLIDSMETGGRLQVSLASSPLPTDAATNTKLDQLLTALGLLGTQSTQSALATKLDSIITLLGTTNATLSTISSTLTGIKGKTDGMNFTGQNLKVSIL